MRSANFSDEDEDEDEARGEGTLHTAHSDHDEYTRLSSY